MRLEFSQRRSQRTSTEAKWKFGPFEAPQLVKPHSYRTHAPSVGPPPVLARPQVHFQHFIINCHCNGVSCLVCVTPSHFPCRVSCNGVKIDGIRNANNPATLHLVMRSIVHHSFRSRRIVATIRVIAGNQLFSFKTRRPSRTRLGQSSMWNGTPLLGIICSPSATEPVSKPNQRSQCFLLRWLLKYGK